MSLDELLRDIQTNYKFLFEKYNFLVAYTFERSSPSLIRIGLVSKSLPNIKLLFVHEWATSLMVGQSTANFEKEVEWLSARRIIDFLLDRPMRWSDNKLGVPYKQFLRKDLEETAIEFSLHCKGIFELFNDTEKVETWEEEFQDYVRLNLSRKYPQLKGE